MSEENVQGPDPIAMVDQALMGLIQVARLVRGYYVALIDAGFDPGQALTLTVTYQTTTLQGAQGQASE